MTRRILRNSRDPQFQGDGWRWTLNLSIPQIRLPGLWLNAFGEAYRPGPQSRRTTPYTIDLLVLTKEQRRWVYAEAFLHQGGVIDGPINNTVATLLMESPVQGTAYLDWFPDEIPAQGYPEAAEEQPQPLSHYPEF